MVHLKYFGFGDSDELNVQLVISLTSNKSSFMNSAKCDRKKHVYVCMHYTCFSI